MTEEDDPVQVWLVDRTVTEKPSLINHTYATVDGERVVLRERAVAGPEGRTTTRAAMEVDPSELTRVDDAERREEFAAEASRMADVHAPDDII